VKDFDNWNNLKKNIQRRRIVFYFREREIRWCNLGVNVGKEVDGKSKYFSRPVLILKKINRHTCLIIPLSRSKKDSNLSRKIILGYEIVTINFGQVKTISTKRLDKLITTLNKDLFKVVIEDFKNFL
jgi:UDP-N-acetylbacillosamine transaminase